MEASQAAASAVANKAIAQNQRRNLEAYQPFANDYAEASWIFTDEAFPIIACGWEMARLTYAIQEVIGLHGVNEVPKSYETFLIQVSPLFSSQMQAQLRIRFQDFDKMVGFPVADILLSDQTVVECASKLIRDCFLYFRRKPTSTSTPTSPTLATVSSRDPDKPWGLMLDGAGDSPEPEETPSQASGATRLEAGAESQHQIAPGLLQIPQTQNNVEQILLEGQTLTEAWRSNARIREITEYDAIASATWSPDAGALGAPVFHGTCGHLKDQRVLQSLKQAISQDPAGWKRTGGRTQIFPNRVNLTGFYTSFSGFRAFIAAAFQLSLYRWPFDRTVCERLQTSFEMNGRTYKGVLLIQFKGNQPAPPGQTHFTVPVGKEEDWADECESLSFATLDPQAAWTELRSLHHQDTIEWPDIVHMREQVNLINSLQASRCNKALLWQTAWMSERSMAWLNARVMGTFAITFKQTEPQPSTVSAESSAPPRGRKRDRIASIPQKLFGKRRG